MVVSVKIVYIVLILLLDLKANVGGGGDQAYTMPDSFRVPSHRLNSVTDEQKGINQTVLLTPSRPASWLTH